MLEAEVEASLASLRASAWAMATLPGVAVLCHRGELVLEAPLGERE